MPANLAYDQPLPPCMLCDEPSTMLYEPCGHVVTCKQCSIRAKKCPSCRAKIKDKTFIGEENGAGEAGVCMDSCKFL